MTHPTNTAILSDEEIDDLCGVIAANTTMRAENDRKLVRDTIRAVIEKLGAGDADFPVGAILNGNTLADRLEAYPFESQGGELRMCSDWVEFRRCFEHLARWAEAHATALAQAYQQGRNEGREEARAAMLETLESIQHYGADTLSGRSDGGPDDRKWQRDAVREMTRRARLAIDAARQPTQKEA